MPATARQDDPEITKPTEVKKPEPRRLAVIEKDLDRANERLDAHVKGAATEQETITTLKEEIAAACAKYGRKK